MVYSIFADYSKKMAHWTIDATFPSSPTIATASGVAGWYGYQVGVTYAPNIINTWICAQIGYAQGLVTAPLITPSLTPYIASYISIGASCATSLTLNLISNGIFRIYSSVNKTPPSIAPIPQKNEEPIAEPAEEIVVEAPVSSQGPVIPLAFKNHIAEMPILKKKVIKPTVKSACCWGLCQKPAIKTKNLVRS